MVRIAAWSRFEHREITAEVARMVSQSSLYHARTTN